MQVGFTRACRTSSGRKGRATVTQKFKPHKTKYSTCMCAIAVFVCSLWQSPTHQRCAVECVAADTELDPQASVYKQESECQKIKEKHHRSRTYSRSEFYTIPMHEFECEADAAGSPVCSQWLEGCFHCHSLPCPLFNRPNGLFRSSVLQSILPERKNPTPKDTLFPAADERWHIFHSRHHPVVPE